MSTNKYNEVLEVCEALGLDVSKYCVGQDEGIDNLRSFFTLYGSDVEEDLYYHAEKTSDRKSIGWYIELVQANPCADPSDLMRLIEMYEGPDKLELAVHAYKYTDVRFDWVMETIKNFHNPVAAKQAVYALKGGGYLDYASMKEALDFINNKNYVGVESGTIDIHIELGNDAMCRQTDVATALRDLSYEIEYHGFSDKCVKDINGNKVGKAEVAVRWR